MAKILLNQVSFKKKLQSVLSLRCTDTNTSNYNTPVFASLVNYRKNKKCFPRRLFTFALSFAIVVTITQKKKDNSVYYRIPDTKPYYKSLSDKVCFQFI